MTLDDQNRKIMIEHNFVRAKSTFDDAVLLVEHDRLAAAVNRIYYALFYTISAMALSQEYHTKKHSQLIGWFNKEYIKTGIFDKKFGLTLHQAFDSRSDADYGSFVEFSKDEVTMMLNNAFEFIETIYDYLEKQVLTE